MPTRLAVAVLAWIVLGSPALARPPLAQARDVCDPARYSPDRFRVAIDRASGLAFVQSPCGWTYIGVVARESIDADIRMSGAIAVPVEVLRAQVVRQPGLAAYLSPPHAALSTARPRAAPGTAPH